MIFDELIFDRTSADVANRTDKGSIAYNDLNRVETACKTLAEELHVVGLVTKTDWVMTDFRTGADMERIRQNIIALRAAWFTRADTPSTPTQITYTSIKEANNIEKILYDLNYMYEAAVSGQTRLAFKLGTKNLGNRRG